MRPHLMDHDHASVNGLFSGSIDIHVDARTPMEGP